MGCVTVVLVVRCMFSNVFCLVCVVCWLPVARWLLVVVWRALLVLVCVVCRCFLLVHCLLRVACDALFVVSWLLGVDSWLLTIVCFVSFVICLLFRCCLLCVVCNVLFGARCLLCAVCCWGWVLPVPCVWFNVSCVLCVVCGLLLVGVRVFVTGWLRVVCYMLVWLVFGVLWLFCVGCCSLYVIGCSLCVV